MANPLLIYCTKCGVCNAATNKFCHSCGASLSTITCSFCSVVNPQYARFCGGCGRKLESERKKR